MYIVFRHGIYEVCIIVLFKYVHSVHHRTVQQAHKILRMKMSAALPNVKPSTQNTASGYLQAVDHCRPMYWAVLNQIRHTLLHGAWTDRPCIYCKSASSDYF
jgi:hypothetical protein